MTRWIWVDPAVVRTVHEEQLAEHGGQPGLRDEGLLDSALNRPLNLDAYQPEIDVASLAAAYAFGIARNHPFFDGNKRTAFVIAELFGVLNGFTLAATDEDCIRTFLSLASGELSEAELAAWYRARLRPIA